MSYKNLIIQTLVLFLLFSTVSTCSALGGSNLNYNHTHLNSKDTCHEISSDLAPFRASGLSVAVLQKDSQDDFFGSFTSLFLLLPLFLLPAINHRIIRLRYGVPRLFNKWTQLFKKGIIHPQIW